MFESRWHSKLLYNMAKVGFFDHELKEFVIHMKQQVTEVLLAFLSFLHAFDRT
jgi:hypothetical protein